MCSTADLAAVTGADVAPVKLGFFNPDANFEWQPIVQAIQRLYACKPSEEIFKQFYSDTAQFEDPLGKLSPSIAFAGLAEFFTPTEQRRFEPVDVTRDTIRLEVDMDYKPVMSPVSVPFKATIILKLDPTTGKIVYHTDHWSGVPLAREGVWGQLAEKRRVLTGMAQKLLVTATGGEKYLKQPDAAAGSGSGSGSGASSGRT